MLTLKEFGKKIGYVIKKDKDTGMYLLFKERKKFFFLKESLKFGYLNKINMSPNTIKIIEIILIHDTVKSLELTREYRETFLRIDGDTDE